MFLMPELNLELELEEKQEQEERALKEERELITIKVNKMMTKNLEMD